MSDTIYVKTELGRNAFKDRSVALIQRQRTAFILFDGIRTASSVLSVTVGFGVQLGGITALLHQGYVVAAPTTVVAVPFVAPGIAPAPALDHSTAQQRYLRAYPLAAQLTASLGLRGFRLHMAVEAADGYEQILTLMPKIREALGTEKCRSLDAALAD